METQNKKGIDALRKIQRNVQRGIEASTPRRRNPRFIIYNVPDEVSIENAKELIMIQNSELGIENEDVTPRCLQVQEESQQFSDRGQFYGENEVIREENETWLERV